MPNISKSFYLDLKKLFWAEGIPSSDGKIGRGERFGDGLFETCLMKGGKLLGLDLHAKRLSNGIKTLGLETCGLSAEQLLNLVEDEISRLFPKEEVRVRLQVSRQGQGSYFPQTDQAFITLEATEMEGPCWKNPQIGLGLSLNIHPSLRTCAGPLSAIKSSSALQYVLAARHAKMNGFDDCLLLALDGSISESSSCNLFIRRSATLITPPLTTGCLPGTMRARVMHAAKSSGIEVQERPFYLPDLLQIQEAFLTNAIRGLIPVKSIEDIKFEAEERKISQELWRSCQTIP